MLDSGYSLEPCTNLVRIELMTGMDKRCVQSATLDASDVLRIKIILTKLLQSKVSCGNDIPNPV